MNRANRTFFTACVLGLLLALIATLSHVTPISPDNSLLKQQLDAERTKAESELKRRAEEERQQRIKVAKVKISVMAADANLRMLEIVRTSQAKAASIINIHKAQIPELTFNVNTKLGSSRVLMGAEGGVRR